MATGERVNVHSQTQFPKQKMGASTGPGKKIKTWYKLKEIKTFGDPLVSAYNDSFRLFFENADGLPAMEKSRYFWKYKKLKKMIHSLNCDVTGLVETKVNWNLVEKKFQIKHQMAGGDRYIIKTEYNKNEQFSSYQQGGVAMIIRNWIYSFIDSYENDPTGLGRWCSVRIKRNDGRFICIIVAYQAVKKKTKGENTVYAQQRRYFKLKKEERCPNDMFKEDLKGFLEKCQEQNELLIIMLDSNENMNNGKLQKMFKMDFDLADAVRTRTNAPGPKTFISGSKQIDAIWCSEGMEINSANFLPFHFGIGDHRSIVVDIPISVITGVRKIKVQLPSMRRLVTSRYECTQKYIKTLTSYMEKHKVKDKIKRWVELSKTGTVEVDKLNSIDRVITEGMIHAEKRCRKLHTGMVAYSPEISKKGKLLAFWRLVYRYLNGARINQSLIKRKSKICNVDNVFTLSKIQVFNEMEKAQKDFEVVKTKAKIIRSEFLRYKSTDKQASMEKRHHAKRILEKEKTRKEWTQIGKVYGKKKMGSVLEVEILKDNEFQKVNTKKEVEEGIISESEERFRLTEGTPLHNQAALEIFGGLCENKGALQALQGKLPTTDRNKLSEMTNRFIDLFKKPSSTRIKTSISTEEYISAWKKKKEETSSSPSGRHFGHYKASTQSKFISSIHATMISIGYNITPLKRWEHALSVMLEKEPGVIKVAKLRAIMLLEADFNLGATVIFGKRMLNDLENRQKIPNDQFARKSHESIEVALNRRLTSDISRQRRSPIGIIGADAAHCYDRVSHIFAIMACMWAGISIEAAQAHFGVLQRMKIGVRTGFGESEKYCGGEEQRPFSGFRQGNGASPALWLLVSIFLFKVMDLLGLASEQISAISLEVVRFAGFAYVDDTDLVTFSSNEGMSRSELICKLNNHARKWQDCLEVSGGSLRPDKCYWYVLWYKWVNGQWKLAQNIPEETINLRYENSEVQVDYLQPNEAKEVVGVWVSPSGCHQQQLDATLQKIIKTTGKFKLHVIDSNLMWKGFKNAFWKSLEYPLSATSFTRDECETLNKKLYKSLLPALGVNQKIKRIFRYAPLEYGGLNLPEFFTEQGIKQLSLVLEHGGESTITGKLIRSSMEQAQLEIGELEFFLTLPYSIFGFLLTDCWVKRLWDFVSSADIKLIWRNLLLPWKSRERDKGLMEIFRENGMVNKESLKSLNRVRCYYKVITVADLSSICGTKICTSYKNVRDNSSFVWQTEHPSNDDFRLWEAAINTISSSNGTLHTSLGNFTRFSHKSPQQLWDSNTNRVYKKHGNNWKEFQVDTSNTITIITPQGKRRRSERHCFEHQNNTVQYKEVRELRSHPTFTHLVNTSMSMNNTLTIEHKHSIEHLRDPSKKRELWKKRVKHWVEEHVLFEMDMRTACQLILTGNCKLVTDGSFFGHITKSQGASFWIIEDDKQQRVATGKCGTTLGPTNPYRAELTGLYGLLSTIQYILDFKSQVLKVTIGCDCEGALAKLNWVDRRIKLSRKNHDIIRAINTILQQTKVEVHTKWIKSHLDDTLQWKDLTRWEQLNVLCDSGAKEELNRRITENVQGSLHLPHENWVCITCEGKITNKPSTLIKKACFQAEFLAAIQKLRRLNKTTFSKIDWDSLGSAIKSGTATFGKWYVKHTSHTCGTSFILNKTGSQSTNKCQCCLQVVEKDPDHILRCSNAIMKISKDLEYKKLVKWIQHQPMDKNLQIALVMFLNNDPWPREWLEELDQKQNYALRQLQDIGLINVLNGYIPKLLQEWQEDSFMLNISKRSGKKWSSELIYNILKAKHNLWLASRRIVHDRAQGGLYMEENREMQRLVKKELDKGTIGMLPKDFALLNVTAEQLSAKPVDYVRGWLVDVYIARGDSYNAEKELKTVRTGPNYKRKPRSFADIEEGVSKRKRQKRDHFWKSSQQAEMESKQKRGRQI